MNISKVVRSAKFGVLGALVAAGMTAVAATTVTVDEVKAGDPWSTITVNYTLSGTDANLSYKVAFDVTAGGQTASVTNGAANLTDGAATKEIDTVALFGKQVTDTKAKVKVSLIAVKMKPLTGVQLWADGPIWAEANIGSSEDPNHPEYGALFYSFSDAAAAVAKLGNGWRLPTANEFKALLDESNCSRKWTTQNGVKGYLFTSKSDASKSIFFPACGKDFGQGEGRQRAGDIGCYWNWPGNGGNVIPAEDAAVEFMFDDDSLRIYYRAIGSALSVRPVQ